MSPPEPDPARRPLAPLSPAALTGFGVVGLIAGWLVRGVCERVGWVAPTVTWLQVATPFFAAAVLAAVARSTWRALQRPDQPLDFERADFQQAVSRLVLARASALIAALIAGGYAGYAVSWLWVDVELADQRALRAGLAAVGGIVMLASALFLQRSCRAPAE
ncbi:MAG: DUF3180 domain-containing protein [Nocardioides sp.]